MVVGGLALTSCSKDDDNDSGTPIDEHIQRTVLVYMAAENNLTTYNGYRYMDHDYYELVKGSKQLTSNQRLLVFIDSLNNQTGKGTPFIVELRDGKERLVKQYDNEFYTSHPDMFREVLSTMINEAKAEEYGLILWGHASGWTVSTDTIASASRPMRAYGLDYGNDGNLGGSKWMNITQMAPYHLIMPYLYKYDAELYQGIIDTYYDYYLSDNKGSSDLDGYSVPLSVIDTRYIKDLAEKTHDILTTFVPTYPNQVNLSRSTGLVHYWYYDAAIMYDMRAVMKTYAPAEDFAQWDILCKKAIPYHRMSLKWMTVYDNMEFFSFPSFLQDESLNRCVSMFVPQNNNTYHSGEFRYNTTYSLFEWNRILDWSRFGW